MLSNFDLVLKNTIAVLISKKSYDSKLNFKILLQLKMDPEHGISESTHLSYFQNFGNDFTNAIMNLAINYQKKDNLVEMIKQQDDKELLSEVLNHAYFLMGTVAKFEAMDQILNTVKYRIYFGKTLKL